jgi:hypothetical protein
MGLPDNRVNAATMNFQRMPGSPAGVGELCNNFRRHRASAKDFQIRFAATKSWLIRRRFVFG